MAKLAHVWISILVLVVVTAIRLQDPLVVVTLRNAVFDTYQRWKPREYRPVPVRIIDIDEETLARFGQWPWPRPQVGDLVGKLRDLGAAVIVIDIIFAEPDRTSPSRLVKRWPEINKGLWKDNAIPDHDQMFADTLGTTNTVIGFVLNNDRIGGRKPMARAAFAIAGQDPKPFLTSYEGATPALSVLEKRAAGNGVITVSPDRDGTIRRVPVLLRHGDTIYPSLFAEALRVAQGVSTYIIKSAGAPGTLDIGAKEGINHVRIGKLLVPTDSQGKIWIHYSDHVPDRTIPAWKLMEGKADPKKLQGHIVLIGTSAAGLMDRYTTPVTGVMSGVEIDAQIIEQVIQRSWLSRPDWAEGAEVVFLVVLGVTLIASVSFVGAFWSAAIGATGATIAGTASWAAFAKYGLLVDPVFSSIAVIAVYLSSSLVKHIQTERKERWIRGAFSSYVSPNLVEELVKNPQLLELGGERRELTFVFTDLTGFTSMVEGSEPSDIVPLLNEYLDGMIRIAFRHDGTIDKVVGDAVHIMFSSPVSQEDHAFRGVACALELDAFAHAFAMKKQAAGIPLGETRIGVNTGMVVIGNFGGESFFDYTAHGDAINTAARLENANKALGTRICVSEATANQCPNFTGRPVGVLMLKGKTKGVKVFEPMSEDASTSPAMSAYMKAFHLLEAEAPSAGAAFSDVVELAPDDPLANFHLKRLDKGETGVTIVIS